MSDQYYLHVNYLHMISKHVSSSMVQETGICNISINKGVFTHYFHLFAGGFHLEYISKIKSNLQGFNQINNIYA